ncbi:MAG: cystathionine gamma-synthase [Planctomycetia bacterium TMED53]|nr:MAG: cystathionine gamma-synthase [Planctomycetia bacterium TMED53]
MKFETRAIHAGQHPDPSTGAVMTPVYLTSTYVQEAPGVHQGYEYSRTGNPTRSALEANLASLEGGTHGLCFASGLAATDAVLKLLSPEDHVVAGNDLYGGTHRIFTQVYGPMGIGFDFVNTGDVDQVRDAITEKTRMVWLETPTNPLLRITDIAAVAAVCKEKGVLLVVDNTFATPYLQQPLKLGADIVVHSVTKYLGGHSDVVGGALITSDDDLHEKLAFLQNAVGGVPGPLDCFLTLRGTKTLAVRLDRHCENAAQIATWLENDSRIGKVFYPGLESHEGFEIASRQMRAPGGMISFELAGASEEEARKMVSRTQVFALAESLGGVESLIEHPPSMTHGAIPVETRRAEGLSDGLIRISVGIESVEDLLEDLDQAIGQG